MVDVITRNVTEHLINDKNGRYKDATVLNSFSTSSDHGLVRARVQIHLDKERYHMYISEKNRQC